LKEKLPPAASREPKPNPVSANSNSPNQCLNEALEDLASIEAKERDMRFAINWDEASELDIPMSIWESLTEHFKMLEDAALIGHTSGNNAKITY